MLTVCWLMLIMVAMMLKIVDDQRVHEALSKLQFYTQRMSQHMVVNIYGDDDDTDGDDDDDN